MSSEFVGVLAGAAALGLLHALGGRLHFLTYLPRSKWLSAAGGVSVAYVFLHLLPEVAEAAATLSEGVDLDFLAEDIAWLIALAGLALFYGLEVHQRSSRSRGAEGNRTFVFAMGSYAFYNFLIGYLLHERSGDPTDLALFVVAIGLHFIINDFSLREHHKDVYQAVGRWLLVAAIAGGAIVGGVIDISEAALGTAIAFIGGGVILNVLKEELPRERESSFGAFLTGTVFYAALMIAL